MCCGQPASVAEGASTGGFPCHARLPGSGIAALASARQGLAALAAEAALSERTAARLFQRETGLSFGRWRGYLRMQVALGHLSAGKSVTETALAVGYQDISSFIEAFRQCLGETPSRILSR